MPTAMATKRLSLGERAHSTQSATSPHPGSAPHKARSHKVGVRPHARNSSYGKNLNKLTKITSGDDGGANGGLSRSRGQTTPGTSLVVPADKSHHQQHFKRNSSTADLPRTGSKVSIKKNLSNVSLKRNGSTAHVGGRTSRPTTPVRRTSEHHKPRPKAGADFTLDLEDEEHDDEWTEEDRSVSPVAGRKPAPATHSSQQQGVSPRPHLGPSPAQRTPQPPASPPASSPSEPEQQQYEDGTSNIPPAPGEKITLPKRPKPPPSALADTSALTTRLLSRQSSGLLNPELTAATATGTHTPPLQHPGDPLHAIAPNAPNTPASVAEAAAAQSSMPDGVSRFLGAPGSGSTTGSRLPARPDTPPTPGSGSGSRASSGRGAHPPVHIAQSGVSNATTLLNSPYDDPTTAAGPLDPDAVRRSRSTASLRATPEPSGVHTHRGASPAFRMGGPDAPSESVPALSYKFAPAARRLGGLTQAKMNLWRAEATGASHPHHHMNGGPGEGADREALGLGLGLLPARGRGSAVTLHGGPAMGAAEQRARLWAEAEREATVLKGFRNPVVESARRVLGRKAVRGRGGRGAVAERRPEMRRGHSALASVQAQADADQSRGVDGGRESPSIRSRPASRAGTRSVRFEVGAEESEEGKVDELLRRMWEGGEAQTVEEA